MSESSSSLGGLWMQTFLNPDTPVNENGNEREEKEPFEDLLRKVNMFIKCEIPNPPDQTDDGDKDKNPEGYDKGE